MSQVRAGPTIDASGPAAPWVVSHRYLVILLLGAAMFVAFLGAHDLWYPDEPDIGQVTKAMFESADWVLPRRNGEVWIDYPPLLYWAGCVSSHALGGISSFSLRLPSALAAILLALATCAAVSRLCGARAGLWAGVSLATFVQFVYSALGFRPDMLFAAAIGCGTFLYAAGAGDRPRWAYRVAGFACFGLALLAKGPLGLLLPGLVLTLWHGSRREWRRLFALAPLGLVALAVALPWYAACAHAMGPEAMWQDVYAQNFERFGTGIRYQGHIRPFHYYFVRLWVDLLPWSVLLPFAVAFLVRQRLWRRRDVQLALWWAGTWFVFLTLAATKRQLYLLPAYPAFALLLAPYLSSVGRDDRAPDPAPARAFTGAFVVVLLLAGVAALVGAGGQEKILEWFHWKYPVDAEVFRSLRGPLAVMGTLLFALGLWVGRTRRRGDVQGALGRSAFAVVGMYLLALGLIAPALDPARTYVPQAQWIREHIGADDRIGIYYPERGRNKMGAFTYHSGALVSLLNSERDVEAFFVEYPDSLVLVHEGVAKGLLESTQTDWRSRVLREMLAGRRRYVVIGPGDGRYPR